MDRRRGRHGTRGLEVPARRAFEHPPWTLAAEGGGCLDATAIDVRRPVLIRVRERQRSHALEGNQGARTEHQSAHWARVFARRLGSNLRPVILRYSRIARSGAAVAFAVTLFDLFEGPVVPFVPLVAMTQRV